MLSLITRGLYDCIYYCCGGRQQQVQTKTTREITEEEIKRVLAHLAATRRPRLSCC